jgi:putative nucleotidyltransferase with HDIG domain
MAIEIKSDPGYKMEIISLYGKTHRFLFLNIFTEDPYTLGHSERVSMYSVATAKEYGLSLEERYRIAIAGLLHDIGKIEIDKEILSKDARLTDEEFARIKAHPILGEKILSKVGMDRFEDIISAVRHHHERYDGKGYPDGLMAEEIPIFARIIAIADTFDAMTSTRSYRESLSDEVALRELDFCSGNQFDPEVVNAFFKAYDKGMVKRKRW